MNQFWKKGSNSLRAAGRIVKPYPLRTKADRLSCNPFFIVSTGRSGTTLLRAILTQHPDLCIPPESVYLAHTIRRYKQHYRRLPWRDIVTLFCGELARGKEFCAWDIKLAVFFHQAKQLPRQQRSLAKLIDLYFQFYLQTHKPEAVRWGDKTPHYIAKLPLFDALFPESQIIHIHRDGRDVVSSYLKLGWTKSAEDACDMWLSRITFASNYAQRDNNKKFLEISYENMVRQPEVVIPRICDFLGINYQPNMLDFHLNPDQFRGDSFRPDLHSMLAHPISTKSIGQWRQALNAEQQKIVQERIGPTLLALGYEVD